MPLAPRRRDLIAGLATLPLAGLALPRPARAAEPVVGDVPLGAEDAPVTVIEYASLTCPHCADFHRDTWPRVKEAYVETGKVRFILREVYFDRFGLWATMVARCGGREPYHALVGRFLETQEEWTRSEDIVAAIRRIGRLNGLSASRIDECLQDRDYAEALVAHYQETAEADGIDSTPSFVINGEKHTGNIGFEAFADLIEAHL
jgi:protein-disulfide isomerase